MKIIVVGTLLFVSVDADACSILANEWVRIDSSEADGEQLPPPRVAVDINRGRGGDRSGCSVTSTSCDDIGWLSFDLQSDNADGTLAYVIDVVEGNAPVGFGDGELAWVPIGANLTFTWIDDASDIQEPLEFTLEISAMNESGSVGVPVVVDVSHPGSTGSPRTTGGCAVSRGPILGFLPLLALLFWRRRR